MEPLLVPINAAARLLGVGVSTAWAMIREGKVETVTLNRRRLVVVETLHRLVEERRAAPNAPLASPPIGRGRRPRPEVSPN
jgi:hypothetical protein